MRNTRSFVQISIHTTDHYSRYQLLAHRKNGTLRNELVRKTTKTWSGLIRSAPRFCEPVVLLDPDGFASFSQSLFTYLQRSQTYRVHMSVFPFAHAPNRFPVNQQIIYRSDTSPSHTWSIS
jgi:hypothetical protein